MSNHELFRYSITCKYLTKLFFTASELFVSIAKKVQLHKSDGAEQE